MSNTTKKYEQGFKRLRVRTRIRPYGSDCVLHVGVYWENCHGGKRNRNGMKKAMGAFASTRKTSTRFKARMAILEMRSQIP